MEEVTVLPVELERLAARLPADRVELLFAAVDRARSAFGDRTIWHVNATAHGGGVAELLRTLLGYANGTGVRNRWLVLDADPAFFTITKRLHNVLHGDPGDGGPLGERERALYEEVMRRNLGELTECVVPGDIVLLHDPQTAGLAEGLRRLGARVVWRCHVGRDSPNQVTEQGWAFLRRYVEHAEVLVFSRRTYAPDWAASMWVAVIPPSIDPYSVKNMPLAPEQVEGVLAQVGLLAGADPDGPVAYVRPDGTLGAVTPRHGNGGLIVDGEAPAVGDPLVVQVSRWDRLKDMAGVMEGFARALDGHDLGGAHLLLAGPELAGVSDDPEDAKVLGECRAAWRRLPASVRRRVHLATMPMGDEHENAVIVNALQRYATVVVQKSLVEGFGLTVTEAMWKARPVVASRLGGIQDQIVDGRDGLLVPDPRDLDEFAAILSRPLADAELAARLGAAARERVLSQYLGDRHLEQYVDLLFDLVRERP
jgi:trehalose synthase